MALTLTIERAIVGGGLHEAHELAATVRAVST